MVEIVSGWSSEDVNRMQAVPRNELPNWNLFVSVQSQYGVASVLRSSWRVRQLHKVWPLAIFEFACLTLSELHDVGWKIIDKNY